MIRAIEYAYNSETGERFSISDDTYSQVERFELRKNVQRKELNFECIECGQRLNIVPSSKDLFYFKHYPNSGECVLKNATQEEINLFNKINAAKESPRHKYLKNLIGDKLREYKDVTTVQIDDKFIIKGNERRKPDVYCQYGEREIVFEIQLSDLSVSYLTSRHEFYKKNGIYLIWILDNFNPEKSTQLVRDIKYLNQYQNFFKLDKESEKFQLRCKFKESYITSYFAVQDKWAEKSVPLDNLTFDNFDYQVFYTDYHSNRRLLEEKAEELKEANYQKVKAAEESAKIEKASELASNIIEQIKVEKERNSFYFDDIATQISKLSSIEIKILNDKLNISKKPSFSKWLKKSPNPQFILFLLRCKEIDLDVNMGIDGKSPFQILHENSALFHESTMKEMFKRGYRLTDKDKESLNSKLDELIIYEIAEKLELDSDIDQIFQSKTNKLIFIIESIKRGKIINSGYKPDEWLAFGNNLVQHYNDYWDYLEKGLKHFGIWNKILDMDKKSTFQNKVSLLKFDLPQQKTDFIELFKKIYPELN